MHNECVSMYVTAVSMNAAKVRTMKWQLWEGVLEKVLKIGLSPPGNVTWPVGYSLGSEVILHFTWKLSWHRNCIAALSELVWNRKLERERQTDRQTDRQWETKRERDRERDRDKKRVKEKKRQRETDRQTDRQTDRDRSRDRKTERKKERKKETAKT